MLDPSLYDKKDDTVKDKQKYDMEIKEPIVSLCPLSRTFYFGGNLLLVCYA